MKNAAFFAFGDITFIVALFTDTASGSVWVVCRSRRFVSHKHEGPESSVLDPLSRF